MKSALRQHFCPAEKVFVYQAELQARRLQSGEELTELARDIKTKTRLAYPEANELTLETLMKQYFVTSLPDKEQRLSVSKSYPRTLTQALAYATEYESIMKTEQLAVTEKKKIRQAKAEDDPAQMLAEIFKKLETLTTSRRDPPRRPPRDLSQVRCYACQDMGQELPKEGPGT